MKKKGELLIYLKLAALTSGLVLSATAAFLAAALQLLRTDQGAGIRELNQMVVNGLAARVESDVARVADKIGYLVKSGADPASFETDPDLVSFTVFKISKGPVEWDVIQSLVNSDYLKLYGLTSSDIDKVRREFPVPFGKVLAQKVLAFNSTLPAGPPLYTVAVALPDRSAVGSMMVAVADVRMDRLLRVIEPSSGGWISTSLSDELGKVAPNAMPAQSALRATALAGQTGFEVISGVDATRLTLLSDHLVSKFLIFALISVTGSFLVTLFSVHVLLQPIRRAGAQRFRFQQELENLAGLVASGAPQDELVEEIMRLNEDVSSGRQ